jgi:ankyrin repeat protein
MLNCLKTLLDAGADPNAHYWEPSYPELPETCLYGVCGINNEPEATALLLAAGADAQDAEALYHGTEHPGIAALRQVLAAGGRIALANGLNHILDRECVDDLDAVLENIAQEPEDVRAPLLRSGGFWAVMRHRSLPHMQKLVNAGLDVNATNDQGLNLVDTARKLGQTALADWLVAQGARESADVRHRFLAACAAGDGPTARRLRPEVGGLTYDDGYVLGDAAQRNDAQAVALMLDLGFPADAPADHRSTGLHQASWHGCHRTVPLLLAAGCPVDVRDKSYDGTPLNWAVLGCPGEPVPDRDWVAVVQALLDFGAARSAGKSRAFLDENSREKPVRPLLVRYGIVKEKM